jgi:hypothetical protein
MAPRGGGERRDHNENLNTHARPRQSKHTTPGPMCGKQAQPLFLFLSLFLLVPWPRERGSYTQRKRQRATESNPIGGGVQGLLKGRQRTYRVVQDLQVARLLVDALAAIHVAAEHVIVHLFQLFRVSTRSLLWAPSRSLGLSTLPLSLPHFLFTCTTGLLSSWEERRTSIRASFACDTARTHTREGIKKRRPRAVQMRREFGVENRKNAAKTRPQRNYKREIHARSPG